jgi:hypothetical protein
MGADAGANMTVMSEQSSSASKPDPMRPEGGRMSLDVFMPEDRLARKRAEARKRAVKRWFNRLLKRSAQPD